MKVKELIAHLQSLPANSQDAEVIIQAESKQHSHWGLLDRVYCVVQNQYHNNEGGGMINQDEYDNLPAKSKDKDTLTKKHCDLLYPAGTVFILSEIKPEPVNEQSKEALILGTIAEGNIPHLRIEKE